MFTLCLNERRLDSFRSHTTSPDDSLFVIKLTAVNDSPIAYLRVNGFRALETVSGVARFHRSSAVTFYDEQMIKVLLHFR